MLKYLIHNQVRTGIVCMLMLLSRLALAQSTQPLEILQYHGMDAKTPLEGVAVSAVGASSSMSDAQGMLTLTFRSLKAGDQIQFRRIDMAGYEVMNTEAIEAARIARQSASDPTASMLHIVMAQRQLLRQLRDGYRSVAVKRYEKQLKEAEEEAERLREAGKLAETEYNERMDQLEEEYETKLSQLETYIEKFARIDLSDLDADEQQIIQLVQQGAFDEALARYDQQDLANRLRQSRDDQAKLIEASQQIAAAEQRKAQENLRLRQSIDRQVTLLRMAGGEENLQKVYRILHETFLADTTYTEARRDYAISLYDQGRQEEADLLLKAGIASDATDYDRGFMMLDLMDTYWQRLDYATGLHYAQQADSILLPLKETHYTVLTRALPAFSSIYLRSYMQNDDFAACQKVIDRARQQWSPDTLSYNSLLSYTELTRDIAEYYSRTGDMAQSAAYLDDALRLGELSYEKFPVYNSLYDAYAEASSSYAMAGEQVKASEAARRSMELIGERLAKASTKKFFPIFAYDLYVMADALGMIENYALCDSLLTLEQRHQLFATLDQNYPDVYNVYQGCFMLTCVGAKLQANDLDAAERLYTEGVHRLENAGEEGEALLPQLSPGTLARLRQAQGRYDEAEQLYQTAIDYFASSYHESGDAWDADNQCRYLIQLADMQGSQGKRKTCLKTLKQAERIAPFESNRQKIAAIRQKYK